MSLQDQLAKLQEFDFSDVDFNQAGQWPAAVKIVFWVILFFAILIGSYFFSLQDAWIRYEAAQAKEVTLKQDFEAKAFQAANLEKLKDQLAQMETAFKEMLKQLPKDTEVPNLLEDITNVALDSGLEINLIKLEPEVPTEYYIELPIKIEVAGGYHDFGAFVSGVAVLPRIVTLHDFDIKILEQQTRGSIDERLTLAIVAKTYRYKELGEAE